MLRIRPYIAHLLMFASLLLLAGFLLWYLRKVWNDEFISLQTQGDLILVSQVRDIEGAAFNQLIANLKGDDSAQVTMPFLPKNMDSTRQIIVVNQQGGIHKKDTTAGAIRQNIDIRFSTIARHESGKVSLTWENNRQMMTDSGVLPTLDTTHFYQRMRSGIQKEIAASGLPSNFKIERLPPDARLPEDSVAARFGVFRPDQYNLSFRNYQPYLLGRLWPQILFSLFLFVVVGLTFFLIEQNMRRQQRLVAIKNDFIRNMTHELKTPIATVSVAIEALQHFGAMNDPVRSQEYLQISSAELNRLSLLVDKVLKMSMFEDHEPLLKPELFDFNLMVQDIVATMRLQLEKLHATIQVTQQPGDYQVLGDRLHLTSVVYNLIDNALKYSPERPVITIDLTHKKDQIVFKISDQGMGIPAAYQHRIFDRFFRVPAGDIHNVKGHGLGLSYVAGVVRQHQGTIRVESNVGQGSIFWVELPVALANTV